MRQPPPPEAPEWDIAQWRGSDPLTLADLRGRVVLMVAFQMLCPACVQHSIPQMGRVRAAFGEDLAVIGLHTVFENHEVMGPAALDVFLSENRVRVPVGIDRHVAGKRIPITMERYMMEGTPTQILIDRNGRLRSKTFGMVEDLVMGARIGGLLAERPVPSA